MGNEEILAAASNGLEADRRAMDLFRAAPPGQQVRTIYLPGLDILRNDAKKRRDGLDQVRRFLEDEISSGAASRDDALIVLACDSHSPALARAFVFDGARAPTTSRVRPEDVTPSILARAGIAAARDLDGRPDAELFASGSLEAATVASYGLRVAPGDPRPRPADREYLEKLKSLGYLN